MLNPAAQQSPRDAEVCYAFGWKHGKLAVKRREFSANEIAAWSGQSLREVERYTKAADQARLARNALARTTAGTPGNDRWLSAS